MYISRNWLKEYVDIPDLDPKTLAHRITMHIAEVEQIEDTGEALNNIIIAKVATIDNHPNADKLKVTQVDTGNGSVQIVCGGTNLIEGQIIPLALPGAMVKWHGEGDLIAIKKGKIRDIESNGMICASSEIGITDPNEGPTEILDLKRLYPEKNFQIGQSLKDALELSDMLIEIDNKSITHRPDLWGVYGFARDLSVVFETPLKSIDLNTDIKIENQSKNLSIENNCQEECPRYMAVKVDNIKIQTSPTWLQEKLKSAGISPKNNIVDATNYIMLLHGQPMHAFDSSKVDGGIIVRKAKDKEQFLTLDGSEKELTTEDLVIADHTKAIALAGVMGGGNSEVDNNTTSIIIESANFHPVTIRKSSQRHGIFTDSSQRFEKSLDPNNAQNALIDILNLIQKLLPESKVVTSIIDVNHSNSIPKPITLNTKRVERYLGYSIPQEEIINILNALKFNTEIISDKEVKVTPPSFRATKDIGIEEDLIEEIARIKGYENIPDILPSTPSKFPKPNDKLILSNHIRDFLTNTFKAYEVMNYSFNNEESITSGLLNIEDHIGIENPLSNDQSHLRTYLFPNLIKTYKNNILKEKDLTFYEFGNTYKKSKPGNLPDEQSFLNILTTKKQDNSPLYYNKQILSDLLKSLGHSHFQLNEGKAENFCHPNKYGEIIVHGKKVGFIGEIHPKVKKNYGIKEDLSLLELNINLLSTLKPKTTTFKQLNKFPGMSIDVSIIFNKKTKYSDIEKVIKKTNSKLIKDITLFDVFESEKIGTDNKAYAFNVLLQSDERTLTDAEMNEVHSEIFKNLEKAGGILRQ